MSHSHTVDDRAPVGHDHWGCLKPGDHVLVVALDLHICGPTDLYPDPVDLEYRVVVEVGVDTEGQPRPMTPSQDGGSNVRVIERKPEQCVPHLYIGELDVRGIFTHKRPSMSSIRS